MVAEVLIILALVLVNGLLAGAEIAILTVRATRLRDLVARGSDAAAAVERLRQEPERFLATVQIGITVVGATAGAFGGATLADDLSPVLARWPLIAPWAREVALVIVVTLVSYLALVLGELVPKSLALKAGEQYALVIARPLLGLSALMRPLAWFLTASSNVLLRPFKDRTSFIEARLSPDELLELVGEAARTGTLNAQAGEIAARALQLPKLVASDMMVPRAQVVVLHRNASREELRKVMLEHTHSRFPVVEGELDRVVGYVSMKDVVAMAWEESLFVLEDLIRPAYFVPLGKGAVDLLTEMRSRRVPFGVVVDERGAMAGIVTLEDVLEELVGEIFSEHVTSVPAPFHHHGDGSITLLGTVPVRDVNREFGFSLPEGAWTTVAGLCLELARRIPAAGERLRTEGGVTLEIIDASPTRLGSVRIHPATTH